MIQEKYLVNEKTISLIPARQLDYETQVIEVDGTFKVKQSPLTIVSEACDAGWCTYDGRRQAVSKNTGFSRKVPIPINIEKSIFAFPTHAPSHYNCHWFFFTHIDKINKDTASNHAIVTLKNKQEMTLPISFHIFKKQYERTLSCMISAKGILLT